DTWVGKRRNIEVTKLTALRPAWLEVVEWDYSGKTPLPKKFKPIDERVKVVEEIFKDCARGIGDDLIARRLNDDGIPTFGRSKGWQSSYVAKILTNRAVLGEYQPHTKPRGQKRTPVGEPIKGYFGDPIISEDLFSRAQNARRQRFFGGG